MNKKRVYPSFSPNIFPYILWVMLTISQLLNPPSEYKIYIIIGFLCLIIMKDIFMAIFEKQQFLPIISIESNYIKLRESPLSPIYKKISIKEISLVIFYSKKNVIEFLLTDDKSNKFCITGNSHTKNQQILDIISEIGVSIESKYS